MCTTVNKENPSEWAQATETPQSCSGCLQTASEAFAAHGSAQTAHSFGGESSLTWLWSIQHPAQRMLLPVCPRDAHPNPPGLTALTGESILYPVLYRGLARSVLLAWSCSPKDPKMYQLSKPRLQSCRKKSKQTSKSPNGGRQLPPVLQEVSLHNTKVCGGDDINTHSGISLPAQLRSSWDAHSSAPRCLLKSPAFLCTPLTTALCASLTTPCIVKSELLAMLPEAGCKITPSPLS